MTKPVTAAAMMALVEDGAVGLDQPIAEFLPERSPRLACSYASTARQSLLNARGCQSRSATSSPTSGLSESFNRGLEPTAELYHRMGLRAGSWDPELHINSLADFHSVSPKSRSRFILASAGSTAAH